MAGQLQDAGSDQRDAAKMEYTETLEKSHNIVAQHPCSGLTSPWPSIPAVGSHSPPSVPAVGSTIAQRPCSGLTSP